MVWLGILLLLAIGAVVYVKRGGTFVEIALAHDGSTTKKREAGDGTCWSCDVRRAIWSDDLGLCTECRDGLIPQS